MSVYNGAMHLRPSVESILSQEGVNFEFIIINDGSTDETPAILEDYAKKDHRVRLIHQENQGLTKALLRGCAEARGIFICRQDSGDISKPGRLAAQLRHIQSDKERVLVSCATDFVGPNHELLFTKSGEVDDEAVRNSLLKGSLKTIRGLNGHGSAFFPTKLYNKVGGYRSEFYFAQDLDLWIRLARWGKVSFCPEVLYEVRFAENEISGVYRKEQIALTKIILDLRDLEPSDPRSKELLFQASLIRPTGKRRASRKAKAKALYYIGRCLQSQGNPDSKSYFWSCVANNPFHLRAWLSLTRVL
ncbi:MAG: glycosyltransferase [Nitrospira sp.]|nr:glycosyltransferase [Nitrospira sp.]